TRAMSILVTCRRLALTVRRVSLKTQLPIKISKLYPSIQYAIHLKNYSQSRKSATETPEMVLRASPMWMEQLNKSEIDFQILPDLCESILKQDQEVLTVNVGKLWQSICARYIHNEKKVDQAIKMFSYLQTLNPNDIQPAVYAILMGSFRGTGKQYEQVILNIWEKLKDFSDIFPSILLPYITQGLCETTRWKEALDIIEMEKEQTNFASINMWKPILIKAVKEGDAEIASFLLNGITISINLGLRFQITGLVQELFQLVTDEQVEFNMKDFCDILEIMRHQPDQSIAKDIMQYFKQYCISCGHKLPAVSITEAEMEGLNDQILNKLILKSDVYLNTNPDEVKRFLKMVETEGPFDVVLDGCNVGIGNCRGGTILLAVEYFKKEKAKKILVIGRDHMKNWKFMNKVKENAIFFPVNNISKDDPFILYAASRSPNTYFVSHDNYSNQVHGDIDREYYPIFCKWLFHRQIKHFLFSNQTINVLYPQETDVVPSYNNQMYHIPCMNDDKIFWLCAKKNW
ncbi:hypothetical protein LOTGIDRAFT_154869, partial [Lottia gigantea]